MSLGEKLADVTAKALAKGEKIQASKLMREAGYSRGTIEAGVRGTFTSRAFTEAMARRGITADKIASVYEDAMKANIVTVYRGQAKETGVPDHKMRVTSADHLATITGIKKQLHEHKTVNVTLDGGDLRDMLGFG